MRATIISDLPQIKNMASADSWLQQANAPDASARLSARKSGRAITCIAVNSWRCIVWDQWKRTTILFVEWSLKRALRLFE